MDVTANVDAVDRQVAENFSASSAAQSNRKPELEKWSIAECLDHLIIANASCHPVFDKVINGTYRLLLLQRLHPFKKVFGPMLVKYTGPESLKKLRNPRIFTPSFSNFTQDIVSRFLNEQQKRRNYFIRFRFVDTGNTAIASPVTSFITDPLADALKLLTGHERRHIHQALAFLHHPNFPRYEHRSV